MSWNWDELQEKRDKQRKNPPSKEPDGKNPFGNISFNKLPKGLFKTGLPLLPIVVIACLVWFASGIFTVNPGQAGVVLRFGEYKRTVDTGPHYHLPAPIESVIFVNTKPVTIYVGVPEKDVPTASSIQLQQASMFTGDGNIIHMCFNVQYTVDDPEKFLFKAVNPAMVIASVAEAAMREVVGAHKVESIYATEKDILHVSSLDDSTASVTPDISSASGEEKQMIIQSMALERASEILETYGLGVKLHAIHLVDIYPPAEVKDAFVNVSRALSTREAIRNKAEAYRAEIVPTAEGTAASIINAAKSYEKTTLKNAEGEAERFLLLATEYKKAQSATKTKLYLETMHQVLSSKEVEKIIVSPKAKGTVLPYLNLGSINTASPAASAKTTDRDAPSPAPPQTKGVR